MNHILNVRCSPIVFGSKTKMPISLSSLNIVIEVLANIVRQEKLKYIRTGKGKKKSSLLTT